MHPTRAFYHPNEPVEIRVPGVYSATIWHLQTCVAELDGHDILRWQPPTTPKRGYKVRLSTNAGVFWTAFDVLDHWTDAPRYGFLFDFSPDRTEFDLNWLLARHINGLQFYDWQYRHDRLLPPNTEYLDPLGRSSSLDTVRSLIDAAHQRGIAAMPYTAIYAASPEFAQEHLDWGLYDEHGQLHDFANGFLKLMNPASAWRDHFVQNCQAVLSDLPFDGVHVDQYGEPRTGFDAKGNCVDLPQAFAQTLHEAEEALPPDRQTILFNLVHNWPLKEIAEALPGFLYAELWPPQTTLADLHAEATQNWRTSGGKPPVLAVYIDPQHEHTVKLAQSVITASGGYHIVHGEDGLYLSDPYYPKAQGPADELADYLKRVADFSVAYSELLAFASPTSVEATVPDGLWLIARRSQEYVILNLVNATPSWRWDVDLKANETRRHVAVQLELPDEVQGVWWVTPDVEAPPQGLEFTRDNNTVRFTIPLVEIWTLVAIQCASED